MKKGDQNQKMCFSLKNVKFIYKGTEIKYKNLEFTGTPDLQLTETTVN